MPIYIILPSIILLFAGITTYSWWKWRHDYLKTGTREQIKDPVILRIAVPQKNEKSPLAAEQLFASLHGIALNKAKSPDHFSLEIVAGSYGIHFICVIGKEYKTFFENQIYSQYPEAQISEVQDYTPSVIHQPGIAEVAELSLAKDSFLPIRTFQNFDVDPLAAITGAVSKLPSQQEIFIQILARPIADTWQDKGKKYVNDKRNAVDSEGKRITLESGESEMISSIERKNSKVGFQFVIRILAKTPDPLISKRLVNEVLAAFGQYRTAVFNQLGNPPSKKGWRKFWADTKSKIRAILIGRRPGEYLSGLDKFSTRYLDEFAPGILNTEELASLYHLPNKSVETPNISWAMSRKLEYPLDIPTKDSRILGVTDYRGVHIPFGVKAPDRLRHMYIIGKTGTGKSTFMEGLIMADIYAGNGVGVIDPHGEMIEHVLAMIPPERLEDVVLFDPGDVEFPIAFNLLETKEGEDKSLIADSIVSVFKKQWADSWGPRLEYILTNTILTLLNCQNVSLMVVPRLLSDANYRKFLLKQLKDPILLKFWEEEYEKLARNQTKQLEDISSILNKVGRFTTNPMIRNIIGQVTSSVDIRKIMDEGKIILVNLAQGKVGEENMALLGGMLITRIYSNSVQRLDPNNRRPFYLYVDEFQNFSTPTFVKILSEARKYGLSLTIAHQFIDQIDQDIRNSIFGNVGTLVNFAVGPRDAEYLVKEYTPYLDAEDLVNLGKHKIVTKLSIDMAQSKPFTAQTLKPNFPQTNLREQVVETSRKKYTKPRESIQQKLYKWAGQAYSPYGNLVQEKIDDSKGDDKNKKRMGDKRQETEDKGDDRQSIDNDLQPKTHNLKPPADSRKPIADNTEARQEIGDMRQEVRQQKSDEENTDNRQPETEDLQPTAYDLEQPTDSRPLIADSTEPSQRQEIGDTRQEVRQQKSDGTAAVNREPTAENLEPKTYNPQPHPDSTEPNSEYRIANSDSSDPLPAATEDLQLSDDEPAAEKRGWEPQDPLPRAS